eukprot:10439-Heterococcus_DN1.PRE.1
MVRALIRGAQIVVLICERTIQSMNCCTTVLFNGVLSFYMCCCCCTSQRDVAYIVAPAAEAILAGIANAIAPLV